MGYPHPVSKWASLGPKAPKIKPRVYTLCEGWQWPLKPFPNYSRTLPTIMHHPWTIIQKKTKAAKPLSHLFFFSTRITHGHHGPNESWPAWHVMTCPAPSPELFFDLISWSLRGSSSGLIHHQVTEVAAVSFPTSQCRAKEDARLPGLPGWIEVTIARQHDAVRIVGTSCHNFGLGANNASVVSPIAATFYFYKSFQKTTSRQKCS